MFMVILWQFRDECTSERPIGCKFLVRTAKPAVARQNSIVPALDIACTHVRAVAGPAPQA